MDSILTSIKKLLGIAKEDTAFDDDIIMHINAVFLVLNQLGVGPDVPFFISDESAYWVDFLTENPSVESIKSYMYMKVKLMFDPPPSTAVIKSMNSMIAEFEWRYNIAAETVESTE